MEDAEVQEAERAMAHEHLPPEVVKRVLQRIRVPMERAPTPAPAGSDDAMIHVDTDAAQPDGTHTIERPTKIDVLNKRVVVSKSTAARACAIYIRIEPADANLLGILDGIQDIQWSRVVDVDTTMFVCPEDQVNACIERLRPYASVQEDDDDMDTTPTEPPARKRPAPVAKERAPKRAKKRDNPAAAPDGPSNDSFSFWREEELRPATPGGLVLLPIRIYCADPTLFLPREVFQKMQITWNNQWDAKNFTTVFVPVSQRSRAIQCLREYDDRLASVFAKMNNDASDDDDGDDQEVQRGVAGTSGVTVPANERAANPSAKTLPNAVPRAPAAAANPFQRFRDVLAHIYCFHTNPAYAVAVQAERKKPSTNVALQTRMASNNVFADVRNTAVTNLYAFYQNRAANDIHDNEFERFRRMITCFKNFGDYFVQPFEEISDKHQLMPHFVTQKSIRTAQARVVYLLTDDALREIGEDTWTALDRTERQAIIVEKAAGRYTYFLDVQWLRILEATLYVHYYENCLLRRVPEFRAFKSDKELLADTDFITAQFNVFSGALSFVRGHIADSEAHKHLMRKIDAQWFVRVESKASTHKAGEK